MNPILLIPWLRLSALALLSLASFATIGCGGTWIPFHNEEPQWESSHRILETKIDRLKARIESDQNQTERADFWRIVSAALVTLVFFALVGGAALGSRARRDCLAGDESSQGEEPLTKSSK